MGDIRSIPGTQSNVDGISAKSKFSMKVGFWSAVFLFLSGLVYVTSFILMVVLYPETSWNGVESFAASYVTDWGNILLAMQLMAFLQPLALVVLISSICDYATADKKILARIGLSFAIAFATISGINYFIQMTVVRQSVLSGHLDGLGQLIQLNPASPMFALVILSWGIFQGLAALAIAPIFGGSRLENILKLLLVIYGLNGLIGGLGCILGNMGIMVAFLAIINTIQPLVVIAFIILFQKHSRITIKRPNE